MTQPAEPNLSQSANELTEAVGTLTASVRKLTSDSRRSRRLIYLTIAGLILDLSLTIVVGVLFNGQRTTNHKIQRNARDIEDVVHSDCPFFKDLGAVDLPAKATTFGIKLVADARTAYFTHGCVAVSGPLVKPDPRLLPYLPPNAR
jgi:hypothetical protein